MPGNIRRCFSRASQASFSVILVFLGGCATPIEIKTSSSAQLDLLDADTVTVKPQWLFGTLAFHPMLAFRRKALHTDVPQRC